MDTIPVLIGFDPREQIAFDVCRYSLLKRSSIPLHVRGLKQDPLRTAQLYRRRWEWRGGQRVDLIDDRPFSTEFSFSRFLVPALCQYEGWAIFVDCDFLFLADVAELLPHLDDTKAVMVAKQMHIPAEEVKMDGCEQTKYRRKNWSSFMLFNCGHESTKRLTPAVVNGETGSWLHQFQWCRDEEIGEVPPQWNWISGLTQGQPKAVHYTIGGPWFADYMDVDWSKEWLDELARMKGRNQKEAA